VTNDLSRREFLAGTSRAALGAAALSALPSWVPSAFAAAPAGMIERNDYPEHWETMIGTLDGKIITPNEQFFVRSHFPVPQIDTHQLEIGGLVENPVTLTVSELGTLPRTDRQVVLECAGNGRGLMKLPNTSGTQWGYGAVGNASWGGVLLSTLLRNAMALPDAKYVWFEGADRSPRNSTPTFTRSLPLEKAMADAIVCDTMNGSPLPTNHGGPLRLVVPGWYGMAWTKWLNKITLAAEPVANHFMNPGYRWVEPGGDPALSLPVETLRVKSLITTPLEGAKVPVGKIRVDGFAWAGPSGVKMVEVSADGGKTWQFAGFVGDYKENAWRRWATQITREKPGKQSVMARATDNAGNVQPVGPMINLGGYGNNAIQKVNFSVTA
jgi:DMSO/TMAO reductase YedYZ molybdopterin-dependent catalytic subunit